MRSRSCWSGVAVIGVLVAPLVGSVVSAQTPGVREVPASGRSVIPLQTRIRFTTMIVLPDGEEILDVICGDKDFWVISATHNLAHIKPAKEGAATNLNLVTASGTVYSFLLTEHGGTTTPDVKVYVMADPNTPPSKPTFYSASEMARIQTELTEARAAVTAAERHTTEALAAQQEQYPSRLQFVYGTPKYAKPFFVRAIWHDGQFTYIKTDAKELPALYEMKDGKPAVVNFQVHNGTYVVPKVIDRGYLALGDEHLPFGQQER
jgi:type IV secretion system protein VirB9